MELVDEQQALAPTYNRVNDNSSIATTNLAMSVVDQE